VHPQIAFAPRADAACGNQLDGGSERELTRRLAFGEMARERAADSRQRLGKATKPPQLAGVANLGPFRMIAVLQTTRGVAPDRLQVAVRIGAVRGFDI